MARHIGRRQFLRMSAMAAAGAAAVACQPQTVIVKETVEVQKEVTKVVEKEIEKEVTRVVEVEAVSEKQAPQLVEMVKGGTLPALDERLPRNPKVLSASRNETPQEDLDLEVGKYGGKIRSVQPSPSNNPDLNVANNEPLLYAPGILADAIGGNVAESFEVADGGRTFVIHLRVGLKWSDGMPVTTEDVQFVYEDILMNTQLTPTFPSFMKTGNSAKGDPLSIDIIDAYSFQIQFPEPYKGFTAYLAQVMWKGYTDFVLPKHFLTQFHADYTPMSELEPLIRQASLPAGEWWSLFNSKKVLRHEVSRPKAVGFPVLNPWFLVSAEETMSSYDRNPYYFKVDEEGQQLPYVDDIDSQVVADVEMSQLKVIAGEVDFLREDATLDNLALYMENADKAGFRVQLLDMHVSPVDVRLNLTYDDPSWRAVVQDARFRRALSLATDRAAIIDAVYFGFAEMPQAVPSDFDPAAANALLDDIGMTARDASGFRLTPDGKPFEIPFEVALHASDMVPVTELIVENYKEVGLNATMKVIDPALQSERRGANQLQADVLWHHGPELWWGALWDYGPGNWAPLWNQWLASEGASGEEPPDEVVEFVDLINQSIIVDGEDREQAIEAYRELMYDNVWIIITAEKVKYPLIVNTMLRNVPTSGYAISADFALEQFYYG